MWGGPSQVDLFDPKPVLHRLNGQPLPDSMAQSAQFAFVKKDTARLLGSPFRFQPNEPSGISLSELLPHLRRVAHRCTFVRSMQTDSFNHRPGQVFMHTGATRLGRPSLGSWIQYGLGTPSQELPAFVVLRSGVEVEEGHRIGRVDFCLPPTKALLFGETGRPY